MHLSTISILPKNEPVFAGVADLSIAAAAKYGELKYRRKRQLLTQSITSLTELRKAMRQYNVDLMIAASAITSHAVLVSADRGFIKMQLHICPELRLEDWTHLRASRAARKWRRRRLPMDEGIRGIRVTKRI